MFENVNVSKLPLVYDSFKHQGYQKSYDEFLEELLNLLINNRSLLALTEDNNIELKTKSEIEQLNELGNYLNNLKALETELSIYDNHELTLAKQNYKVAVEWGKANQIKLKPANVQTFSDLYTNLIPLSSFFIYYD